MWLFMMMMSFFWFVCHGFVLFQPSIPLTASGRAEEIT
jgi:hypothetical protein